VKLKKPEHCMKDCWKEHCMLRYGEFIIVIIVSVVVGLFLKAVNLKLIVIKCI
jgi:hypothetical protein